MTIFGVEKAGKLWLGYLLGQLEQVQLPADIAIEYVRRVGAVTGKNLPEPKGEASWAYVVSLEKLQGVYPAFSEVVGRTIDAIREAAS